MVGRKEEATVREINEQDFLEVIESGLPAVIDFSAAWCMPCRSMSDIVDRLSQEYQGKVKFYKLDVDKNTALADKLNVKSVPTLLFFRNNNVDAQVGLAHEDRIKSKIERLISS